MKHDSRHNGFTILELLISMAVGMVLIAGAYGVFIS
ncbi:MAG: prepilin-type N-terminal cleavage/methylation domain-containing protein [Candidatus Lernaella stagnicola]|nr:prepilin-type N-terminal cleavage/methylation domain-containing protein [Candidatus Lernaella stagnicola]